jgi:uncharacterized protein (DUF433 family)
MNDRITEWLPRDEPSKIAKQMSETVGLPAATRYLHPTELSYEPWQGARYLTSTFKSATPADVLIGMRLTFAAHELKEVVEIDPARAGGVPVVAGTRITVARILAEIADGRTLAKLSRDFEIDKETISKIIHGLAIYLDRPMSR